MKTIVCGLMMGCADVVPGVSGGTVALLLGIYERLILAISHIDRVFIRHLSNREIGAAIRHADLLFLVLLAAGVGSGFLAMTLTINKLFASDLTRTMTLATFFGMIFATGFVIMRLIDAKGQAFALLGLMGAAGFGLAIGLTTIERQAATDPSLWYLFLCGMIGICAMILPGISGAMILWILGVYLFVTELPRSVIHGEQVIGNLFTFGIFALGCLVGILTFSKVLRWLLKNYQAKTMSVLTGFVFGALASLWPFQVDQTPDIEKVSHKTFAPIVPSSIDLQVILAIACAAIGAIIVWRADRFGRAQKDQREQAESLASA